MLGLIFLYFIGKRFYELALDHNQSGWGFAILGVASFYIGQFIFGIGLVLVCELIDFNLLDNMNETLVNLAGIPFGLATVYVLYRVLESNWVAKQDSFDDLEL